MNFPQTQARKGTGFSLIEVIVAVAVLVVGVFGTMAAIGLSSRLRQTSRESEVAAQFLQERLQLYRGSSYDNVVALINASGTGALPAADLALLPGGFITTTIMTEAEARVAFPADIDGNGVIDNNDQYDLDRDNLPGETTGSTPANYSILVPIQVTIEWEPLTDRKTVKKQLSTVTMLYRKRTD